jgi:cysteine-rich repeat protein
VADRVPRIASIAAATALVLACGDDAVGDGEDTGTAADDDDDDDATDDGPESGDDDDGSSDASADSTGASTGTTPADCGDGEVQGVEQCDDGNETPGDGCEPGCLLPSGEAVWTLTVDARGGDDVANAVAVTPTGDIVVVGGQTIGRSQDVWVATYDAAGEPLASTTIDFGEGLDDLGNGVALLDDGAIAIAGTREQASDPMIGDALVVVLEPSFEERWSQVVDGGLDDNADAISVGPGGVAVAGLREDEAAGDEAWFAVYDVDGGETWSQTDGGPGDANDAALGIAWLDDGGLVVVGRRQGQVDLDLWISGRDGNGGELWSEVLDFDFDDDYAAHVVVVDGTIWATGMTSSALTNSEEVWIASYAPDGTPGDATTWNSNGFTIDAGAGIAVVGGDVFIAGESAAPDEQRNVFVGRFGSGTPEPTWFDTQDSGAGLNDGGTAIALLPDGSVVATGFLTVIGEGTNAWIRRYAP